MIPMMRNGNMTIWVGTTNQFLQRERSWVRGTWEEGQGATRILYYYCTSISSQWTTNRALEIRSKFRMHPWFSSVDQYSFHPQSLRILLYFSAISLRKGGAQSSTFGSLPIEYANNYQKYSTSHCSTRREVGNQSTLLIVGRKLKGDAIRRLRQKVRILRYNYKGFL